LEVELGQIAVVIGRNGTNKTTLLRSIALGLADTSTAHALLAQPVGRFVRTGESAGVIEIELETGDGKSFIARRTIRTGDRTEEIVDETPMLYVPLFAYGAGRGVVGGDSNRATEFTGDLDQLLSLFDYRKELADPELTLRRLQDYLGKEYERAILGLHQILELGPDDKIELASGGGIDLTGPSVGGGTISLAGWADGYRLTLSWLVDLYGRAMRAGAVDEEGNVHGIVLIDELDQHLHPSLQAGLVDHLENLLPQVQVISTTHSPLLALGAQPTELVVLRRYGDEVRVQPDVPDYRGFSAEDMLADDRLFGAPVYAPKTADQLERYGELVSKGESRSPEEHDELLELAQSMRAEELPPVVNEKVVEATAELERRLRAAEG
jgi:hypothetical protein